MGAIAARRTKEKVSERKRRMSIPLHDQQYSDHAMKSVAPAKISASPDVHMRNKHREIEEPHMSAALSSIYVSKTRDSSTSLQYGSVEKSDGDLYNMLASSAPNVNTSFRSSNNMSDVSGGEDSDKDDDNSGSDVAISHSHSGNKITEKEDESKSPIEYSDEDFEQEENETKEVAPVARRDSVEEIKQRWFTAIPVESNAISAESVAVDVVSMPEKELFFDNPDIRVSLNIKSIDTINDVKMSEGDAGRSSKSVDENAAADSDALNITLPDQQQSIVEYDRSNSTIYPPPPSSDTNSMVSEISALATNIAIASDSITKIVYAKKSVVNRYDDGDDDDDDDDMDSDDKQSNNKVFVTANNSKATIDFVQNILPINATQMFRYSKSDMELDDDMELPVHNDVKGKRKTRTAKATSSRGTYTKTIVATKENNVKGTNSTVSLKNKTGNSKAGNLTNSASSVLAKVNQKFKSNTPVSAVAEIVGLQQPPRRSISNRRGAGSNPTVDAAIVSRLEDGTRKLAKQFEELEREMKSLKTNKSEIEAQIRSNITRSNMSLVNGSSNQNTPARSRVNETKVILKRKDIEALENSTMSKFDRTSFEAAALDTMKMLAAKGETLHKMEKGILQREGELSLKESLARAALLDTLQINIHTDPKVISDQEFQQMKQKEVSSNAEIDKLKATIFELNTEKTKVLSEFHKIPSRFLDVNKASLKKTNGNDTTNEDVKGENVTIPKSEYDALLLEIQTQDNLLVGFQKENERLVKEQKVHLADEASRKAAFFDQQEQLNKELNRLRNVVVGDNVTMVSITRKSVDQFRAELDADAAVRALRERLAIAEAGAGIREKELQLTIDKLRSDYRQLITENNYLTNAKVSGSYTEQQVIDQLNRSHKEEIDQLHEKLAWYAENQQIIEDVVRVKVELNSTISLLKKELKKRGVSANDMKQILETTAAANKDDTNNETTTTSTSKSSSKRNPADIKKIKDLEKTIAELQESLLKRNPNSVASLIQAAKDSDSVQIERKNNSDDVAAMKKEVAELKEMQEKRLRSLRQEHEKVKAQYEKRINDVQAMAPLVVTPSLAITQQKSKSGNTSIKSLTQALVRIKELEDDVEKVRTFYSKRVEEVQRKSESQMRALKRGDTEGADDEEVPIEREEEYKRRIKVLEEELHLKAGELSKVTRENVDNKNEIMQLKGTNLLERIQLLPPVPPSIDNDTFARLNSSIKEKSSDDIEKEIQERLFKLMSEFKANERSANHNQDKSKSFIEQQLREEKESLMQKLMDEREAASKERSNLSLRLREEEMRASSLGTEVINLRSQLSRPSTPQMAQFVSMENQILHLDSRLQRREKELMSAIDEGKIAAKMELGRLQAIHMQELREKDEQLVRFQVELESLVSSLKNVQKGEVILAV